MNGKNYSIKLGRVCPTDCTLILSRDGVEIEVMIESVPWNIANDITNYIDWVLSNGKLHGDKLEGSPLTKYYKLFHTT